MLKIIIAEDEEIIRQGLVRTLPWSDYNAEIVGEAADGEEALALIRRIHADVVITDIRMPRLSGLELARILHESGSSPRIIFLTSYADFTYAQQAIRLGAADYLLKPVDEAELAKVLAGISAEKEKHSGTAPEDTVPLLVDWQDLHPSNPYVRSVLACIVQNYQKPLSIEELAMLEGISASYLSRKLKEETGHTFSGLITRCRLQSALGLLHEGRWRVYEIAEQTGFGDYKNFVQAFRKYLGLSPTEYQKQQKDIR